KLAADEHFAVTLNGDGLHEHPPLRECISLQERPMGERRIERAVGIEAGDVAIIRVYLAADDDLAVTLRGNGQQEKIGTVNRTGLRVERRVERAIRVEARNTIAGRAVVVIE